MVQNLSNFPAQMLTPTQKLGKQVAEQLQVSLGLNDLYVCLSTILGCVTLHLVDKAWVEGCS